ncbi:MAG TPA: ShlB/FhaC/HecB family hemolysin secretion/activation protein [Planctomycetota bacterium]|nr:ShlB/FhaC/HecB family hemolysin secretion/activation protein [Planctomycetota bacterium]
MGTSKRSGFTYFSCELLNMGNAFRRRTPPIAPLAALLALAFASPAWAQGTGPDADHTRRIDADEKRMAQEPPSINVQDRPELKSADDSKVRLKLRAIKITGNVSFGTEELHGLVADIEGKEVTLADLRSAARRITMHYRSKGYGLSWAYLPEQVVKDGDIEIAIVEARIDRILVQGNTHYDTDFILNHVVGVQEQESFELDTLERGLLSLNEYPGLSVSAKLAPGGAPGTSDLYLAVRDKYPVNVAVDWDNYGAEEVAENRLGVTVEAFNLFELGHWVSVRGIEGFGDGELRYISGSYNIPFSNGARLGLFGSSYSYEAAGALVNFDPVGDGVTFGATFSYPFIKTVGFTFSPEIGYEHKDLTQELLGIETSNDRVRALSLGARFEWNDDFNGRWLGSLMGRFGLDGFAGGLESDDPDASRAGAGGDFTKINIVLYRLQRVASWIHLVGRVSYQYSADPLVVSEQMSLGGPDSVRGYPSFEVMGDRGYNASIEARIKLPFLDEIWDPFNDQRTLFDLVQLAAFADVGEAELEQPSLGEEDSIRLSGAGVGLRVSYPGRLTFRFDVGWPTSSRDPSTGDEPTIYMNLILNLF